LELYQIY